MANETLNKTQTRSNEWKSFIFITVFLFPLISILLVSGYGFTVWFLQMFIMGPPGHG